MAFLQKIFSHDFLHHTYLEKNNTYALLEQVELDVWRRRVELGPSLHAGRPYWTRLFELQGRAEPKRGRRHQAVELGVRVSV